MLPSDLTFRPDFPSADEFTTVATLKYLAERTSIPVPSVPVLAFRTGIDGDQLSCYALLQKPSDRTTLPRCVVELYLHGFDAIGGLVQDNEYHRVGSVVAKPFFAVERHRLPLDRGPFNSAKVYCCAYAQCELDSSMFSVEDAPRSYQQGRLVVERIAGLLYDLTNRCQGLDKDDSEMAPFSLDVHELSLKKIYVAAENYKKIVPVVDWQYITSRPLWCCARLPAWLRRSLSTANKVARVAGNHSTYDAFRDDFLLLPALENILATLPGHENVAKLTALLDPTTLSGRVARMKLLTRGSNAIPSVGTAKEDGTERGILPDAPVLAS
ncbi:hypothetical protein C8Q74DRAFT_1315484 [Fomes fomentarius]|nr:hypothetical protein C8Q74DRAFT_1315484 [Fomes fomentarius]